MEAELSDVIVTVLCGIAILLGGAWFVPREMKRIRRRLVDRGKDPTPLDAMVGGAPFRAVTALVTIVGVIAVGVGLYWLVRA